jgi:hypothetical protein
MKKSRTVRTDAATSEHLSGDAAYTAETDDYHAKRANFLVILMILLDRAKNSGVFAHTLTIPIVLRAIKRLQRSRVGECVRQLQWQFTCRDCRRAPRCSLWLFSRETFRMRPLPQESEWLTASPQRCRAHL